MQIRKEGYPFIAVSGAVSLLLVFIGLGLAGFIPVLFVIWFFRDPERTAPDGKDLVIAPADGTVQDILSTTEERVGPCTKVSIFMSVFDVHVNRSPVSGTVIDKRYRTGAFHMANVGKKTEDNERMILYIENEDGVYRVDQVAGLIARRIISFPEVGERVEAGQRIGLIRFGSLVECYMPAKMQATLAKGNKTIAGSTVIGRKDS